MNIFDEHNIIITLLVIIILWLFYLTFREEPQPINILSLEGFELTQEAVENIAAIYNNQNLQVTNLTATGSITNAALTNKLNSLQNQINTKQPKGDYVKYGDSFAIRNAYGNWASYLDTCGGASCSNGFSVYTHMSRIRDRQTATTTWRLEK
jgi:hypothetical protein